MTQTPYFEDSEQYLAQRELPHPWPQSIQLELTAGCNLRCVMCPLTLEPRDSSQYRTYSLAELYAQREAFEQAYEVELAGYCEATLHPQFLDVLRFFKQCRCSVWLTTNGLLLTPERSRAIVDEGLLDVLEVSIDAASPATYAAIRRGGDFAALLHNLRSFDALRRERSACVPSLRLLFLPMKPNLHELDEFCRLCHSLGADMVVVQGVYIGADVAGANELMLTAADRDTARQAFHRAAQTALELGLPIDFRWHHFSADDIRLEPDGARVKGYQYAIPEDPGRPFVRECHYLWSKIFIKANREVQLCATLWNQQILGNLRDQSLSDIWNDPCHTALRRRNAGTDPIKVCRECSIQNALRPHLPSELPLALDFGERRTTLLAAGFYPAETDEKGRSYRWARQEATFFLSRQARHNALRLDLVVHPRWNDISGEVFIQGKRAGRFDNLPACGGVVIVPLDHAPIGPLAISVRFDREVSPQVLGLNNDYRKLSARFYRAELLQIDRPQRLLRSILIKVRSLLTNRARGG